MISEMEDKDLEVLLKEVTEKLTAASFIKWKEDRKGFLDAVLQQKNRTSFLNLIRVMANSYVVLLKENSTGKRFGHFEQAWLKHIHGYVVKSPSVDETTCFTAWEEYLLKQCNQTSCETSEQ